MTQNKNSEISYNEAEIENAFIYYTAFRRNTVKDKLNSKARITYDGKNLVVQFSFDQILIRIYNPVQFFGFVGQSTQKSCRKKCYLEADSHKINIYISVNRAEVASN